MMMSADLRGINHVMIATSVTRIVLGSRLKNVQAQKCLIHWIGQALLLKKDRQGTPGSSAAKLYLKADFCLVCFVRMCPRLSRPQPFSFPVLSSNAPMPGGSMDIARKVAFAAILKRFLSYSMVAHPPRVGSRPSAIQIHRTRYRASVGAYSFVCIMT